MRFIINSVAKYSILIEAAKTELERPKIDGVRFNACQNVLNALKADYANMRKAIGKSANRTSPLVENANIYLTAKELIDFADSQEDRETSRFCQVTIFGALRLIEERLAKELGNASLSSSEKTVIYDVLDDVNEWANEEANDAYQRAQF